MALNLQRGTQRMRRASRWMVLTSGITLLLFLGLAILGHGAMPFVVKGILVSISYLALPTLLLGGVIWLAVWFIEGFVETPATESDKTSATH